MKKYKIEKNISIAAIDKNSGSVFADMEVGDSILIPNEDVPKTKPYGAAFYYGKRNNKKFVCRAVKSEGGYRIWRTE